MSVINMTTNGAVRAMTLYDPDGDGPAESWLIAAGEFTQIGGIGAERIARWTGSSWTPLDGGFDGPVLALAVHDFGAGPELVAGGAFTEAGGAPAANIARWRTDWQPLAAGFDGEVRALLSMPVGDGAALVAGGAFLLSSVDPMPRVAVWDGDGWQRLGFGFDDTVNALATYDDGSGPALYAAGRFLQADQQSALRIARWDGAAWSAVGGGALGEIFTLATFDDGSGEALYAGGRFSVLGGQQISRVGRWNGLSWAQVGDGLTGGETSVHTLTALDFGTGPALYAGGSFRGSGFIALSNLARWSGATWTPFGEGLDGTVFSIASFENDNEPTLWIGGNVDMPNGGPLEYLALWRETGWVLPVDFPSPGFRVISGAETLSPGLVYFGGEFEQIESVMASHIASWDNEQWRALGAGLDAPVTAMLVRGDELIVGGEFGEAGGAPAPFLARWDGVDWSAFPGGPNGVVTVIVGDQDPQSSGIAIAGYFHETNGLETLSIARWDGAEWLALGSGLPEVPSALAWFNGELYAAGRFASAGGVPARNIARWNGSEWLAAGDGVGMPGFVEHATSLAVYDDGSGAALYVGGFFTIAGGAPASNIARWNGSLWSPVAEGLAFVPATLQVHDDGRGPALFVGGSANSGETPPSTIARWDGLTWSFLPSSAELNVAALTSTSLDGAPALLALGHLDAIDTTTLLYWVGCAQACVGDLDGDNFIGFADLNIVVSHFNEFGDDIPGDIDGDGQVGFADLNIVLSAFNSACPR